MLMYLSDLAPNGELMKHAEFDTESYEDSRLFYFFRQVVEQAGVRAEISQVVKDPEDASFDMEILWLREETEAAAMFIMGGRRLLSISLTAEAYDRRQLPLSLRILQQAIVYELKDTGYEPAFHLRDIKARPLAVILNWGVQDAVTAKRLRELAKVVVAAYADLEAVKSAAAALKVQ